MHVDYAAFPTSMNGGSPILSYELSIYNTTLMTWTSITGSTSSYNLLNSHVYSYGVVKGVTY